MRKRKRMLGLLLLAVVIGCTSCQKLTMERPEDNKKYAGIAAEIRAEKAEAEDEEQEGVAERVGAPGHWSETIADVEDMYQIVVDADVDIPDAVTVPMSEIHPSPFTEEELRSFLQIFFGDAEYYEIRQLSDYSKQELEETIKQCQETVEKYRELDQDVQSEFTRTALAEGTIARCEELLPGAPEEPVYQWKELVFTEGSFFGAVQMEGTEYWAYMSPTEMWIRSRSETPCTMESEEGIPVCEEILEKLGIADEYSLNLVKAALEEDDEIQTGWSYQYERVLGDVNVNPSSTDPTMTAKLEHSVEYPYGYEQLVITVADTGLSAIFWANPTIQGELLVEDVELISFDRVQDIFRQEITGFADETYSYTSQFRETFGQYNISQIKFGYMPVRNPEEIHISAKEEPVSTYTLVPVWEFYVRRDLQFTINAIDGSILDRGYGY